MSSRNGDVPRVCVFTSAHDTSDARVVHHESASLAEAGYDVTYYTPFEGDSEVETVAYADEPPGSVPSIGNRLRNAARVTRVLLGTDYDVYHFHDVEVLPVGVLLGLTTDAAVVYDVHENVEEVLGHKDIFPEPLRPFLAEAASAVELGLATFADAIVAASPDVADRFEGYDDVTTVTNYPTRRWAEETSVPDATGEEGDGPVEFVYRGLLSENRGTLTLLEAIDRVPGEYDVRLLIGGRFGSDEERTRIERRIEGTERVQFVEWLPTLEDMIDHYRGADVGTMLFHPDPNKTNAVHRSNKLFQYMAAGLPILVSDVGDWPEFVDEVGCGVAVDPEDPDAIAEAIVELAGDPERRRSLARNGHEAALDRYNWDSQREKLLALYRRLTGSDPR